MNSSERSARNTFVSFQIDRASELREQNARLLELHMQGVELLLNDALELAVEVDSAGNIEQLDLRRTDYTPDLFQQRIYLGAYQDRHFFARKVDHPADVESLVFKELRGLTASLDNEFSSLAAYARGLLFWHQRHRYCGVCGYPSNSVHAGHRRLCTNPNCATEHFPRTDPAIIVAVEHEGSLLLGRQASWPERRYSTLAGFVEPGESLEAALAREVFEETGVVIRTSNYVSSQPWPFPSSLMLGFHASAESKQMRIGAELDDARWFSFAEFEASVRDSTLKLPTPVSISFRLIEEWYQGHLENTHQQSLSALLEQRIRTS
jgi:NAD+ diphosphatase